MVACAGTAFCNVSQIETKKLSRELSQAVERRLGKEGRAVALHWSGCHAGCGNHQAADTGLRGSKINVDGKLVDAVTIYTGGRTGRGAIAGTEILDSVPCDERLVDVVAHLIEELRSSRVRALAHAPSPGLRPIAELVSIDVVPPISLQPSRSISSSSPSRRVSLRAASIH